MAGQAIAPAVCVGDHEMVVTLNMPAMKAYLARKDHRSLATLPGVALALNDRNRPAAVGYCDTPRVFRASLSLLCHLWLGGLGRGAKGEDRSGAELLAVDRRRSAPHLRPDITTVERTPHGLQLTCRYCLPTGGANGPLYLVLTSTLGGVVKYALPLVPSISQGSQANQNRRAAEATHAGPAEEQSASPSPSPSAVNGVPPVPGSPYRYEPSAAATVAPSYGELPAQVHPSSAERSGPDGKKREEDATWNRDRYDQIPILGPYQAGTSEPGFEAPSADEVMQAFAKARPIEHGDPLHEVQRTKVRINVELLEESVDPPRTFPTIGEVQAHHRHFKCTVSYTEIDRLGGPAPKTTIDEDCEEVIYIDRDHLHHVGKLP